MTTTQTGPIDEVIETIIKAVNLHHLPPGSITSETSLRDNGLGLDSIDVLEVVVALEHRFGVKFTNAEESKKNFRTVGGIAAYVQVLRSAE